MPIPDSPIPPPTEPYKEKKPFSLKQNYILSLTTPTGLYAFYKLGKLRQGLFIYIIDAVILQLGFTIFFSYCSLLDASVLSLALSFITIIPPLYFIKKYTNLKLSDRLK